MPTYVYETTDRTRPIRRFEVKQSFGEKPLLLDPATGELVRRLSRGVKLWETVKAEITSKNARHAARKRSVLPWPKRNRSRRNSAASNRRVSDHEQQSRRRSKMLGFIIAETVAIIVLLLAATLVVAARPVDSTIATALNVLMFAAAGGVATIPILFFALAPILPRSKR
jgi:hypothetical protein